MTTREAWLNRLANLNVARTERRGLAPHKPLMLLTIMDMIEDRSIASPWIAYSAELFFRFSCYWDVVYDRQLNRPDMRLPFHALGGHRDRIWERYTDERQPSRSRETTTLCHMDESLWDAFHDSAFRRSARIQLVAAYFEPIEQIALCASLKIPEPTSDAIANIRRSAAEYKKSLAKGRDSKFRSAVLTGYQFTCALTGYRINTDKEHLVEAAHIYKHSESGDDDPRNGLALTPDAHWMFDRGLWTADFQDGVYLVRVALGKFNEDATMGKSLAQRHGGALNLSGSRGLQPDPKRLAWHRDSVFIGLD
jgi:putative restriction endonuclease